jgi:aldehyde dehydrogenase (NAD+)
VVLVEGGVLSGEGTKVVLCETSNAEADNSFEIVQHETFAPVLYLLKYSGTVENALSFKTEWLKVIFCDYD